ncbi:unnamed protein product [Sphenostylis stenocarpa]|uniref:Uncharacterized protein n=1 Tax=Sphenostylis stenocarpa TaxID=92480 RepID=A0AA86VN18_9FABA|nr:unnamed protein product [Sphenostylis stenocarpa]
MAGTKGAIPVLHLFLILALRFSKVSLRLVGYFRRLMDKLRTKKLVTGKRDKVCRSKTEGGVGVIFVVKENQTAMLKLAWECFHGNTAWESLMLGLIIDTLSSIASIDD